MWSKLHILSVAGLFLIVSLRPDITFYCDLDFDPFLFMQDNEKTYGMHTSEYPLSQLSARRLHHHPSRVWRDYRNTLADRKRCLSFIHLKKHSLQLFHTTVEFMEQNPDLIAPGNGMGFLSDDNGFTYNRCHCMLYHSLITDPLLIAHSLEQF